MRSTELTVLHSKIEKIIKDYLELSFEKICIDLGLLLLDRKIIFTSNDAILAKCNDQFQVILEHCCLYELNFFSRPSCKRGIEALIKYKFEPISQIEQKDLLYALSIAFTSHNKKTQKKSLVQTHTINLWNQYYSF